MCFKGSWRKMGSTHLLRLSSTAMAVLQQNHLFLLLHFQSCRRIASSHLVLRCSWKSVQQASLYPLSYRHNSPLGQSGGVGPWQSWPRVEGGTLPRAASCGSTEKVSFCFFSLRDEKWMLWPSSGNQLFSVSLTFSNLLIMNMALCNSARLDQAINCPCVTVQG